MSDLPHDLRALARALGGEVFGQEVLAPGPGRGPRNRSMSVKLSAASPLGFLAHSFRGEPWPVLRDFICARLNISPDLHRRPHSTPPARTTSIAQPATPVRDEDDRIAAAVDLFRESADPNGTPAEAYFASRGLTIDDLACRTLRWNSRIGAAVALFRNLHTGAPQAVSRTFLDPDARKIERKFLGPVGAAAVMLDGFDAVTGGLHVAEGVETAQAARQLGLRPTWALGSAGAIASFPVLVGIEALTICAEHDDASARATAACAARWHAAGREVVINHSKIGSDLNDAVKGSAA